MSRRVLIALGVAAAVIAAVVVVLVVSGGKNEKTVPGVIDQRVGTALVILQDSGFKAKVTRVTNARAAGRVLTQDPTEGKKADDGSTVNLTVSNGPGDGIVPDVTRLSRDEAEQELRDAGFVPQTTEVFSDSVPAGLVAGTSVPAGTKREKDTVVVLEVSRGPQEAEVPNVTGEPEATAKRQLKAANFVVEVVPQLANRKPGSVLGQNPPGGAQAIVGSTVKIVVDREPTQVAVPDVLGEAQDAASQTVSNAGLSPVFRVQQVTNPAQNGKVIQEDPGAGTKLDEGSQVTLVVGSAPTPPTPPTPTPPTPPTPPPPTNITRVFGVSNGQQLYTVPIPSTCDNPDGGATLQPVPPATSTAGAQITRQGTGQDEFYAQVTASNVPPGTVQLKITVGCQ